MNPQDRAALAEALELALVACWMLGILWPSDDPDLVELGRAVREARGTPRWSTGHEHGARAIRLRQCVVERNIGLAYHLAGKVQARHPHVDRDEIRQVAAMELVRAVARYRPERARSDKGYLSFCVERATTKWATRGKGKGRPEYATDWTDEVVADRIAASCGLSVAPSDLDLRDEVQVGLELADIEAREEARRRARRAKARRKKEREAKRKPVRSLGRAHDTGAAKCPESLGPGG